MVDQIVRGYHDPGGELTQEGERRMRYALDAYGDMLRPWARAVARHMVADVDRRNERLWRENSKEMGRSLLAEIQQAPTGMLYQALMDSQVELITSLPKKAGQRVHDLVTRGLVDSRRAEEIGREILRTGDVTAARARLIARTEVSRAAASFTQARAMYVGSEGYVWRTSRDGAVRDTHREQEGRYIRWDSPPKTDEGIDPYHAGCGPNCRCFPDPVFPDFNA